MADPKKYAPLLKLAFDPYFNAPAATWEAFAENCEHVVFKKDEVLKSENTVERYFYFIVQGSAGIFLWKDSRFVCLDFAFDRHFCSDYMSLLTKQASPLQVVALENSEMLRMPAAHYERITHEPMGQVLRMVAAESSYLGKQLQQIALLTQSAKERYALLQQQFPGIQNRIAQHHIASYLGITPQSLSRIRRECD